MKVLSAILLISVITLCATQSFTMPKADINVNANVDLPKVNLPKVHVNANVDLPKVKLPKVHVKVNVPKVSVPKANVKVHVRKVTKPKAHVKITVRKVKKLDLSGSCPQASFFGMESLSKPVAAKSGNVCGLKTHCCKNLDGMKSEYKSWIKRQGKIAWTNARIMSWVQHLGSNLSKSKLSAKCGYSARRNLKRKSRMDRKVINGGAAAYGGKKGKYGKGKGKNGMNRKRREQRVRIRVRHNGGNGGYKRPKKTIRIRIHANKNLDTGVKAPKIRVRVTKRSNKINPDTFLKNTRCRLPFVGLMKGLYELKKYNKWFVANYTKCAKAYTKFRVQTQCAACDNTEGKNFTNGLKLKSLKPVIDACQDVTSFSSTLGRASGFAWAGFANVVGVPYVPNVRYIQFQIEGVQHCLSPKARLMQSFSGSMSGPLGSAKVNVNGGFNMNKAASKYGKAMKNGMKLTGDAMKKGYKASKNAMKKSAEFTKKAMKKTGKFVKKSMKKSGKFMKKVGLSWSRMWRHMNGQNWTNPLKVVISEQCETQWAFLLNIYMRQLDLQLYDKEFFFMGQMISGMGNAKIQKEWAAFHVDKVFNPSAVKTAKISVKVHKKRQLQSVSPGVMSVNSKTGVDVTNKNYAKDAKSLEAEPEAGQTSAASSKLMTVVFAMSAIILSFM